MSWSATCTIWMLPYCPSRQNGSVPWILVLDVFSRCSNCSTSFRMTALYAYLCIDWRCSQRHVRCGHWAFASRMKRWPFFERCKIQWQENIFNMFLTESRLPPLGSVDAPTTFRLIFLADQVAGWILSCVTRTHGIKRAMNNQPSHSRKRGFSCVLFLLPVPEVRRVYPNLKSKKTLLIQKTTMYSLCKKDPEYHISILMDRFRDTVCLIRSMEREWAAYWFGKQHRRYILCTHERTGYVLAVPRKALWHVNHWDINYWMIGTPTRY